ncbi:DNA binding HTH domain protein [Vibrio phage 1.210.O._10N.222.52.C2]|nr:DNA binding HTH domain protein [Vibrio phage 1.210.O._10N.222.52.C2]
MKSREFKSIVFGCEPQYEIEGLKTSQITVSTLQDLLVHTRGNQTKAAELLGAHRQTIKTMLQQNRPNVILIENVGDEYFYKLMK